MTKIIIPRNDTQRKSSFNITRSDRKAIYSLANDNSIVKRKQIRAGNFYNEQRILQKKASRNVRESNITNNRKQNY